MWDTLEALQTGPGLLDSSTWIDDLSFDLVGSDPLKLAKWAVLLYEGLNHHIESIDLSASVKKSGVLVSAALSSRT